ncbi:conjugal transfer protein TraF, partial [Neisseria gonorrhoeae]
KNFADQYGIKVMPVSLDGGGINHFPRALPNNGIAQRLNITTVPAMYVMDTKTKQFTPIGFGVMAQTTLEDRFLAYSRPVGTLY